MLLRDRANASYCTAADIDIDYILDERARELLGEENRWITLNRLSVNPNATYISDCHPIQDETTVIRCMIALANMLSGMKTCLVLINRANGIQ